MRRAHETADARMDLVRQSAQAMERRVADTVELLVSLLRYFRSKGTSGHLARQLPAIHESDVSTVAPRAAAGKATSEVSSARSEEHQELSTSAASSTTPASPVTTSISLESPNPTGTEPATDLASEMGTASECASEMPFASVRTASLSGSVRGTGLSASAAKAVEKHPLFASRLCYRSEAFFWSWASSKDFCAEGDALWQWQKSASATRRAPSNLVPLTATAVKRLDRSAPARDREEGEDLMRRLLESRRTQSSPSAGSSASMKLPCAVHIDLSGAPPPPRRAR